MGIDQIEIQLIASITAASCALPGAFLILRRMSMMSDAISHSILLGIVLGFFVTRELSSPLLVVGAALTGGVTVTLVELLNRTRLLREDASIAIVFPMLFSIGVILIARHAGRVHLDIDAVLLGELAFAPFNRLFLFGKDLGPKSLYVMGSILLVNVAFVTAFYKELKVSTFDAGLAASLGFYPALVHYGLMGLVSVTAVGAFDAVGSILVVALFIAPPAAAYLLTDRLGLMIVLGAVIGMVSAVSGYWFAHAINVNIAGSMASAAGALFALVYLFAPEQGLIALFLRRRRQRVEFAATMLAIHLLNHEGTPEEGLESAVAHLQDHLGWEEGFSHRVLGRAQRNGLVVRHDDRLVLTNRGRALARETLSQVRPGDRDSDAG